MFPLEIHRTYGSPQKQQLAWAGLLTGAEYKKSDGLTESVTGNWTLKPPKSSLDLKMKHQLQFSQLAFHCPHHDIQLSQTHHGGDDQCS